MGKPIAVIYTSEKSISHKQTLREGITKLAQGTWRDYKLTHQGMAAQVIKFGAGAVVVGGAVAQRQGAHTPLKWALKGFGPLPAEFTEAGAIQSVEFFQLITVPRLKLMARSTVSKLVLVTVAFEGGVLIGSLINQGIPEPTQDAIGGTIDEIINHGGWKELWRHPFGIGM